MRNPTRRRPSYTRARTAAVSRRTKTLSGSESRLTVYDPSSVLARKRARTAAVAKSEAVVSTSYTSMVTGTRLSVSRRLRLSSCALEIETFHSEDHQEALAGWAERRQPRFTGR